jgi:hypothetical protein
VRREPGRFPPPLILGSGHPLPFFEIGSCLLPHGAARSDDPWDNGVICAGTGFGVVGMSCGLWVARSRAGCSTRRNTVVRHPWRAAALLLSRLHFVRQRRESRARTVHYIHSFGLWSGMVGGFGAG